MFVGSNGWSLVLELIGHRRDSSVKNTPSNWRVKAFSKQQIGWVPLFPPNHFSLSNVITVRSQAAAPKNCFRLPGLNLRRYPRLEGSHVIEHGLKRKGFSKDVNMSRERGLKILKLKFTEIFNSSDSFTMGLYCRYGCCEILPPSR